MRLLAAMLTAPTLEEENRVGPVVRAIDAPKVVRALRAVKLGGDPG